MYCSPPGSSVHGILQARILEWVAFPSPIMKVKSQSEVAQSCPTLRDPMGCSLPGSSVHGIFQERVLEWGAIAFIIRDMQINNTMRCHFTPVIMTFLKRKTNIGEDAEKKQLLSTLYFSVDHLVMSMCRVFPCIVGRECLLWPVHFLGKTLLVSALLHSAFQGQICSLSQIFLDFLVFYSSPL